MGSSPLSAKMISAFSRESLLEPIVMLNAFLFSLGCYSGESITVVSKKKKNCVVSIKDARYSIDKQLAEAILI